MSLDILNFAKSIDRKIYIFYNNLCNINIALMQQLI